MPTLQHPLPPINSAAKYSYQSGRRAVERDHIWWADDYLDITESEWRTTGVRSIAKLRPPNRRTE